MNIKNELNGFAKTTWSSLKFVGDKKTVKLSYVWLLIVPLTARILDGICGPFHILGATIVFPILLPFSWKCFYFAALLFSMGSFIYARKCPKIISEYRDYSDFVAKGHGSLTIIWNLIYGLNPHAKIDTNFGKSDDINRFCNIYCGKKPSVKSVEKLLSTVIVGDIKGQGNIPSNNAIKGAFWWVYNRLDNELIGYRVACNICFKIGFVLLFIVLVQNIISVVKYIS